MLFAKGSRVRFKHTGDQGEVIERIDDNMVTVRLDDGDEIPAFLDHLERLDKSNASPVKAKVVKIEKPPAPKWPDANVAPQYSILKSMGIQLAFDPDASIAGPATYQMYLINDTPFDVIFNFSLSVNGRLQEKVNGKLEGVSIQKLGTLPFDSLNDSPRVELECWKVNTQGTGQRFYKDFRIKPQQFFKRIRTAPILNKQVHHYKIFEDLKTETSKKEDLRAYTKRNQQLEPEVDTPLASGLRSMEVLNPEEFASFKPEIDLHIKKLTPLYNKMNKADILRLQMKHFEAFIEKALRIGVDRVFVIHGVGKGKLKDVIAKRLEDHSRIKTFKNEYHPSYGFGATEVILE